MRPIKKKSHRRNRRQMILWRRLSSLMLAVCLIGVVLLSDHLTGVLAREDVTDIESIETAETDAEAEIGAGEAETVEQTDIVDCQPVETQEEPVFIDEMPYVDMEDAETDSNDAADAEVNVEEDEISDTDNIAIEDEDAVDIENELDELFTSEENQTAEFSAGTEITDVVTVVSGGQNISSIITQGSEEKLYNGDKSVVFDYAVEFATDENLEKTYKITVSDCGIMSDDESLEVWHVEDGNIVQIGSAQIQKAEGTVSFTVTDAGEYIAVSDVATVDLAKANVIVTEKVLQGIRQDGRKFSVSFSDKAGKKYRISQSNKDIRCRNTIEFSTSQSYSSERTLILDGINTSGDIEIPARYHTVIAKLLLRNLNQVHRVYYGTGDKELKTANKNSKLTIDTYYADSSGNMGQLYIPYKMNTAEEERNYVLSKISTGVGPNWSQAGIGGGRDQEYECCTGLTIAGGKIRVLVQNQNGATAIGGGGNGDAQLSITGGDITAICSSTGTAIGGGIGWINRGGVADISITGGTIYAENMDQYTRDGGGISYGGVAIGSGSSMQMEGNAADIKISGGSVTAYARYGNGIGSGNSYQGTAAKATISISGNANVTTNALGGGTSKENKGGDAEITVVDSAAVNCVKYSDVKEKWDPEDENVLGAFGIGGGNSAGTAKGGSAVVNISGGALSCNGGNIGGGDATGTGDGGDASICISGGTLDCASIGGGNSVSGTPGSVTSNSQDAGIVVTDGTLKTGTIGGGTNGSGEIGFATAKISGGNIQGQFILANTDTSKNCFFHMTGGTIDNTGLGTAGYKKAQPNGGAVYLSDPNGEVNISGGIIQNATAELGGAVYMTSGSFTLSRDATIQNCVANGINENNTPAQGGAVYLDNGIVTMNGGCILSSRATQGGAVYLNNGTVTLSDGTIGIEERPNVATEGAGVYVAGGKLTVNGGSIQYNTAVNGAGAYLKDGSMEISAGQILHNTASENGAGAYLAGGTLNVSGGVITENTATQNGGGVYLNAGNMSLSGGNIEINKAVNGAGAYLNSGNLNISNGGAFTGNTATQNGGGAYLAGGALTVDSGAFNSNAASGDGGGAYLAGGTLTINGGAFGNNTATNGGGAYAADGKVRMFGGNITNNTAIQNGGGFYVSSDQQAADVVIRSGNITGNSAGSSGTAAASTGNGGAIAVVSSTDAKSDKVVVGLLETHKGLNLSDHKFTTFDYTDSLDNKSHNHSSCPELKNNKASGNGGAIYMSSSQATLNIYCLEEENNTSTLNSNGNSVMAEGGTVVIGDLENNNQSARGNIVIGSSMLVSGGNVDVYGNMDNPYFKNDILVDIKSNAGEFDDHRISASETTKEYKVHYYENFVTDSGIFKAKQYGEDVNVSAEGALFVHEGFKIIGWDTQADGTGTRYAIGATIGSKDNHSAWVNRGDTTTEDDPLVLYAIWQEISYTVKFDCNTTGQHSGNMEDQKFTYGEEQTLTSNTYKVTGKRFNGWNTSADGTGTSYTADYKESKMSSTDGATVTLYAQWVDCTHKDGKHPGTLTYTIADNKAQKTATITENCDCGGYTASVTLSAVDAYHDGSVHPATLNYTGKWLTAKPTITYQYKSGSASEYGAMPGNESEPMSTGFYKATIKVNDNTTVSVEYQIKSPAEGTTVDVKAAEGEYFTDFSGQDIISGIPADDAFTVQYTIQKLNTQYYTAPSLHLSSQLPKDTTVIMQTGGTYWYYTVASDTAQLVLAEFSKMGSADKFTYDTTNITSNQTYRFIFDLSGASSWSLPGDGMKINLIYNSISTKNGGQNDDVSGTVTINFQTSVQFGLSVNDSNVTVTAPDNNGYSRWSGRSMLLKVGSASDAENKLPADAKLTVISAGSTGTYTLNQNGQFIVPFSWSANKTFSFALNSDTISARGKRYSLTVSLAVAPNTASSDLVSAMEYDTGKTADFSVQIAESTAPSLKITGSQRLVSTTTAELDVTVNMKNTEKCTVQATIQMKTGENYSGTYLSGASVNSGENKFSLGGITEAGSYRLLIQVIKDSQNILEVPYYFNVQ